MKTPTGASTSQPPPAADEDQILDEYNDDIERAARSHAARLNRHHQDRPGLGAYQADDLAQEARVALLDVLRTHSERNEGYLRVVIRNAILNASRRRKVEAGALPYEDRGEAEEYGGDPIAWRSVRAWLLAQTEQHRLVFEHLIWEEKTQREVANQLGVSQPRVAKIKKELLARAADELAHLIK